MREKEKRGGKLRRRKWVKTLEHIFSLTADFMRDSYTRARYSGATVNAEFS